MVPSLPNMFLPMQEHPYISKARQLSLSLSRSYLCHFICIFHSREENKSRSHIHFINVLYTLFPSARMYKYCMFSTRTRIFALQYTNPMQVASTSLVVLFCFHLVTCLFMRFSFIFPCFVVVVGKAKLMKCIYSKHIFS